MKKVIIIWLCICMTSFLCSCGASKQSIGSENIERVSPTLKNEDNSYEMQTSENETTEWTNPYIDNYRVISSNQIYDSWGDFAHSFPTTEEYIVDSCKETGNEACIAIISLVEIGNEIKERKTSVRIKIDTVISHNGVGQQLKEDALIWTTDDTDWQMQDDGTYKISYSERIIPLAEVGYKYVVALYVEDEGIQLSNISMPFDGNNQYKETMATVKGDTYMNISDATLWYYDINPSYYLEYWNNKPEEVERLKAEGKDVFDKEWLRTQ